MIDRELFRTGKVQLTETHLARIIGPYMKIGFVGISADRNCKSQYGLGEKQECSDEQKQESSAVNKENEKRIRVDLASSGFAYIPTWGGAREEYVDTETGETKTRDIDEQEASFLVPAQKGATVGEPKDPEELFALAVQLAKKYDQTDFLWKPPSAEDMNAYLVNQQGDFVVTFPDVKVNDLSQIYFSKLRRAKEKIDRRFSMVEGVVYLNKPPQSVSEARLRYGELFLNTKL